jgi:tripartite-type tricarboxylate transporter receptor subunit TctC
MAARAAPDGYTLLFSTQGHSAMAAAVSGARLGFDPFKDLAPITVIGSVQNMLVVHPSVPARTPAELLALARDKSTKLNAATLGSATTQHLAAALFNSMGKTDILLVPYKGSAPGINDLISGHVQVMFNAMPSTLPHVKAGQLRALAVTGAKRTPLAPELPTMAETLPGFEIVTWFGVLVPTGTPPSIIARLNAEFAKANQLPDVKKKLLEMGLDVQLSDPETFGTMIKSEITKWAEVIRVTNVKAE